VGMGKFMSAFSDEPKWMVVRWIGTKLAE